MAACSSLSLLTSANDVSTLPYSRQSRALSAKRWGAEWRGGQRIAGGASQALAAGEFEPEGLRRNWRRSVQALCSIGGAPPPRRARMHAGIRRHHALRRACIPVVARVFVVVLACTPHVHYTIVASSGSGSSSSALKGVTRCQYFVIWCSQGKRSGCRSWAHRNGISGGHNVRSFLATAVRAADAFVGNLLRLESHALNCLMSWLDVGSVFFQACWMLLPGNAAKSILM